MKRMSLIAALAIGLFAAVTQAQNSNSREPGVPVRQAQPDTRDKSLLTPPAGENQRLYGPRAGELVTQDAARAVSERFRAAYAGESAPRIVIYVNRALVEDAGLKLTGRTERFHESSSQKEGGERVQSSDTSGENTYEATTTEKPSLADRQTVRDVERLFGRVFRHAGAMLADQSVAATIAMENPGVRLGGEAAARQREALKQVADIAIEILISSRSLIARGVSGDVTLDVPDIQATAIRLSDAAILGQASASDVLGAGARAAEVARSFAVADITEATAFALIEDMLTGK